MKTIVTMVEEITTIWELEGKLDKGPATDTVKARMEAGYDLDLKETQKRVKSTSVVYK